MTVSAPYLDTSGRRRTPDWLVTVRAGGLVHTYRFSTLEAAQEYIDTMETPK
jgi:hypothetical protein